MSMSEIIRLPRGCVRRYVPVRVDQTPTGVGYYNAEDKFVGFVKVHRHDLKDRVEKLLIDAIDPKIKFKQPDWSFLQDDDVVEEEN